MPDKKKMKCNVPRRDVLPGDKIKSVGRAIEPYTTSATKRQLI